MVIKVLFYVCYEMFQRICCNSVNEASAQGYSLWQFRFRKLLLHKKNKFLQGPQMGYSLQPRHHFTGNILHTVHTSCQPALQHHNSYNRTDNYRQWNAVGSPDDGHKDARNINFMFSPCIFKSVTFICRLMHLIV